MQNRTRRLGALTVLCLLPVHCLVPAGAEAAVPQSRIAGEVNNGVLARLPGNVHPLARAQYDQGAAPADLPMERMVLVLTPSAAQQTALETMLRNQQYPRSPQYHQWLTPQQFGEQFGAADEDIQKITSWLQSQGFQINRVSNGKTFIEFS
ncbi:MAG: hypothetical protein JOY54_15545, partial [Acidobacteriaceae bacterium]|nr:hypothetical protein [Acidobacteriaceae bacterium]